MVLNHLLLSEAFVPLQRQRAFDASVDRPYLGRISQASDCNDDPVKLKWQQRVHIRKTIASDLGTVASFLATAQQQEDERKNDWPASFKARIDSLFAKADIESLLRGRLRAIKEGVTSWRRVTDHIRGEEDQEVSEYDPSILMRHWWSSSDGFRNAVHQAATATAESNVWNQQQQQNGYISPHDSSWLQHLQLTALSPSDRNSPVGFCEVAMLRRRTASGQDAIFPAILNLAVSPAFRRQGIARRLLTTAERYVQRYWTVPEESLEDNSSIILGLYVDRRNSAARALYLSAGFVDSDDNDNTETDSFIFMTKRLVTVDAERMAMTQ